MNPDEVKISSIWMNPFDTDPDSPSTVAALKSLGKKASHLYCDEFDLPMLISPEKVEWAMKIHAEITGNKIFEELFKPSFSARNIKNAGMTMEKSNQSLETSREELFKGFLLFEPMVSDEFILNQRRECCEEDNVDGAKEVR